MIRRILICLCISIQLIYGLSFADSSSGEVTALKNRIGTIRGWAESPLQADVGIPVKCGTPEMISAFNVILRNSDSDLALAIARPVLPLSFGSDHFLFHYAVVDTHAVYRPNEDVNPADSIPDYINNMAEIFERSWSIEIDSLGFSPPPNDNANGGDGRLDIYSINLGFGFFGFTIPESISTGYEAFSYIVVENDFGESSYSTRPLDGLRVTAAHEFFHTVQFGYDAFEYENWNDTDPGNDRPWWLEASSTWMEDVVYDEINDYWGYLRFFYNYPWMSLTTFSQFGNIRAYHPYASCVWPMYLAEKYDDPGVVREVWERCGDIEGYNVLPATDDAMVARGSSLDDAFLEFSVWNFHTGPQADTALYFSEGDSFPVVDTSAVVENLNIIPYFPILEPTFPPEDMAATFIVIKPNQVAGGIRVEFDGHDLADDSWRAAILGYRPQTGLWTGMPLSPGTWQGTGEWRNWNSYEAVVFISAVTGVNSSADSTHGYTGRITYVSDLFLQRDVGPIRFLAPPAAGRKGDPVTPVVQYSNQGQEAATFAARLIITDASGTGVVYNQAIDVAALPPNNIINVEFPQFTPTGINVRYILKAISEYTGDQLARNDTITASYRSLGGVGRLFTAYPSPFVIDGANILTIPVSYDSADPKTRLFIYDTSGGLVREIAIARHPAGSSTFLGFKWDGRNGDSEYVASGVYIYMINSDGSFQTGKIAVLNQK
jgi:hypothetical protein